MQFDSRPKSGRSLLRSHVAWYFLIIAVVAIVFSPSLFNGFTDWDDDYYIQSNPLVANSSLHNLPELFRTMPLGNYIPLVLLTFAVEYHLFGLNPLPYHLTNVLLHLGTSAAVFALFLALDGRVTLAVIATVLWAVHPTKVEAVAWVAGRKDLLAGIFFVLSLVTALRAAQRHGRLARIASPTFFLLACLSKPTAVTLPLVMLLPSLREGWSALRSGVRRVLPYFAVSLLFGAIVMFARWNHETLYNEAGYGFLNHLWIFVYRLFYYYPLRLLLPAIRLDYYPAAPATSLVLLATVLAAAISVALIFLARRGSRPATGLVFYAVTLTPAMAMINFGYSGDRFLYLPSLGVAYALALAIARLVEPCERRRGRTIALTAFVALCIVMAASSAQKCTVWKDSVTIWTDAIASYPEQPTTAVNRAMAYTYRGRARHARDDIPGALSDLDEALRLAPGLPEALLERSRARMDAGDPAGSFADVDELLLKDPENGEAYSLRSGLHYRQGNIPEAHRDAMAAQRLGWEPPAAPSDQ